MKNYKNQRLEYKAIMRIKFSRYINVSEKDSLPSMIESSTSKLIIDPMNVAWAVPESGKEHPPPPSTLRVLWDPDQNISSSFSPQTSYLKIMDKLLVTYFLMCWKNKIFKINPSRKQRWWKLVKYNLPWSEYIHFNHLSHVSKKRNQDIAV